MASISVPCPKISVAGATGSQQQSQKQLKVVSFHNASKSNPSLSFASSAFSGLQVMQEFDLSFSSSSRKQSALWTAHAKLNEVIAEKPSNCAPVNDKPKSEVPSSEGKVESAEKKIPDASAIAAFITQVSDLVKLVDSRDIMELQMKQSDCELIIRKKEALQQPAPVVSMPPAMPHLMYAQPPPAAPASPPAAAASPAASAPAPALPAPPKPAQSSHPPLKCPMAGTFYRSPAPGEPPFIKVGDKVQKGQVICIIEAMKLMNEIEADQSGTVAEVLADDGKPVSVDTPLFVIVP
ncbi:biotin carboxyl carrier protein of acetyl-CoA carboxylase 2, chloroplastic-like isoform X1 [Pistacia vera]|uniref:biotin carboxyl carrier protein of acetyl-CoA carboxylase 2, chloroplastic-like isoform X1 n=1 Tax=Pistacia vera TaxID=55513 RepID=UPI00126367B0|nr:biotin carboxyl carrier protein of acetyl-CoA carboxylase 2, chloroplastic-like isoform X1 [Pistacia vera]